MIPYLGKNLEVGGGWGRGEGRGWGGEWGRGGGGGAALWKTPLGSHLKAPLGLNGSMLLIPVTVYIFLYIKCCYSATVCICSAAFVKS